MSLSTADASETKHPVARWEWMVLAGLLLIAVSFRFAFPERLAVEHFDEGVYASNIFSGDRPEGTYPAQHLYAPPLLPCVIEFWFVMHGPSNTGAMLASQFAGAISVLLLWWLGRTWFGPVAGLVAALLCTSNEVLILLSRSALTDALLGMWWLAAIWMLRRACDTGSATDRLVAGLLVGLAWFTKYNGWMPVGIVTGAVILRGLLCRGIWSETKKALTSCLISGLIGFATWLPWLWSLQAKGGYASVAANHRQYIVGVAGWLTSASRQYQQLTAMLGPFSEAGLVVCYATLVLLIPVGLEPSKAGEHIRSLFGTRLTRPGAGVFLPILGSPNWLGIFVFCAVSVFLPVVGLIALVTQGLTIWLWQFRNAATAPDPDSRTDLGYWILGVWFGGLFFATPLYSPFLRLTLPWVLSACLGVGLTFQQAWQMLRQPDPHQSYLSELKFALSYQFYLVLGAAGVAIALYSDHPGHRPSDKQLHRALPDQTSFRAAAQAMADKVKAAGKLADVPSVIYVYAEPSLLFQLRLAELPYVTPVSSLQFARSQFTSSTGKIYLATGIHASGDSRFREQFAAERSRFRRVGRWNWQLGTLTALDQTDCNPRLLGRNPVESAAVDLYEVVAP